MAKAKTYVCEAAGPKVYFLGQIGIDPGNQDAGASAYTGTLKTERIYPAGRQGLCHFRRVAVRLLRQAPVGLTITAYVDEAQTQTYDSSSNLVDQSVTFSLTGGGEQEDVVEMDINAVGAQIQVKITVDSDDIDGFCLIEPIEAHLRVVRQAQSRTASAT